MALNENGVKHDKNIRISTAKSRTAKTWKQQDISWLDFLKKISVPDESEESLEEYKAMPKEKQDNLKDVGGFVGGELTGSGRTNANVGKRSLITLDADSVLPGGTQKVIEAVKSLECSYAIYSTRKHEERAPRLRVIIPLQEPCAAEEYEPIARKIAAEVDMGIFDPTTFQPARMMFWPSVSSNSKYVFEYGDAPFIKKEDILSKYTDWRDVSEWPGVPEEEKIRKAGIAKQQNPREKTGIVGSFCRIYDIAAAIDKFLPDVYTPFDGHSDRYTYTGGSTVGGAVVYENGNFLFSNHSTDPAGGKLCNAFDLVRLHMFGELDKNAEPGTVTTKLPSWEYMLKLAQKDGCVKELRAIEDFDSDELSDVVNYPDRIETKNGFKLMPTIDNFKVLLNYAMGVQMSLDMIRRYPNFSCTNAELARKLSGPNRIDTLITYALDYCTKEGIKACKMNVRDWLNAVGEEYRFNPIKEYLEECLMIWGGVSVLPELISCFKFSDNNPIYETLIRKWLIQCVAMPLNEAGRYGAEGILTLKGDQGMGKTSFFRIITSEMPGYFKEGASIDKDKDTKMETTAYWITELGELERTTRKEVGYVKQFITNTVDEFRRPFGGIAEKHPRFTSFGASVNDTQFLTDIQNRRFWVVPLDDMDLDKLRGIDISGLWAEVYNMYKNDPNGFRLTKTEQEEVNTLNKEYTLMSNEEQLLLDCYDWEEDRSKWMRKTASEIAAALSGMGQNVPANRVGKALRKMGYRKDDRRHTMTMCRGISHYYVPGRRKTSDFVVGDAVDEGLEKPISE